MKFPDSLRDAIVRLLGRPSSNFKLVGHMNPLIKYRPDIDGLRALAVLSVVVFHAFPSRLRGGYIGVDVFFFISGYLISTILFESLRKDSFSFSDFYARRINRIFPALSIVLIVTFICGWMGLFADEFQQLGKHIFSGASFLSNFALWNEAGYFDNSAETKPLLHLWSLGVEEQFYILWPFILWLSWKRKFNLLTVTSVVLITSFALNMYGIRRDIVGTFYSPLTRFWEILSGSILAWFTLHYSNTDWSGSSNRPSKIIGRVFLYSKRYPNILSLCGSALLFYGFTIFHKDLNFPGAWAILPVVATALLINAGPSAWINRTILSSRFFVWLGLISFPFYLWHWPLLSFARIVESEIPTSYVRLTAVILSALLAWMTYYFVEMRFKTKHRHKAVIPALCFLMAIIAFFGAWVYVNGGMPNRSSIKTFAENRNELVRQPGVDEECIKYINNDTSMVPYCRLSSVGSSETVALIGDSHAHAAYPGFARKINSLGKNAVLLANSSCPHLLDAPFFGQTEVEKENCRIRIERLINLLRLKKDIKSVFLVSRGPYYLIGKELIDPPSKEANPQVLSPEKFLSGAQGTIDVLTSSGKKVFLVTENPELTFGVGSCLGRPLRFASGECRLQKSVVLERQKGYLQLIDNLKKVTIIRTYEKFCPGTNCLIFDGEGRLMYADDDHLSVSGSFFQADKILSEYF